MNKNSFFRPILFLFTITLLSASQLFAAESSVPLRPYIAPKDDQDAEFANIVAKLDTVQAPFIQGQNLVFTAKNNARHIGIAFEHEEYKTIHSFKIRNIYDADYKVQESLQFFIIKLPKDVQVVRYRLIIDGLWTTDPYNSNKTYSDKCGVLVSQVDANRSIPFVTEQKKTAASTLSTREQRASKSALAAHSPTGTAGSTPCAKQPPASTNLTFPSPLEPTSTPSTTA